MDLSDDTLVGKQSPVKVVVVSTSASKWNMKRIKTPPVGILKNPPSLEFSSQDETSNNSSLRVSRYTQKLTLNEEARILRSFSSTSVPFSDEGTSATDHTDTSELTDEMPKSYHRSYQFSSDVPVVSVDDDTMLGSKEEDFDDDTMERRREEKVKAKRSNSSFIKRFIRYDCFGAAVGCLKEEEEDVANLYIRQEQILKDMDDSDESVTMLHNADHEFLYDDQSNSIRNNSSHVDDDAQYFTRSSMQKTKYDHRSKYARPQTTDSFLDKVKEDLFGQIPEEQNKSIALESKSFTEPNPRHNEENSTKKRSSPIDPHGLNSNDNEGVELTLEKDLLKEDSLVGASIEGIEFSLSNCLLDQNSVDISNEGVEFSLEKSLLDEDAVSDISTGEVQDNLVSWNTDLTDDSPKTAERQSPKQPKEESPERNVDPDANSPFQKSRKHQCESNKPKSTVIGSYLALDGISKMPIEKMIWSSVNLSGDEGSLPENEGTLFKPIDEESQEEQINSTDNELLTLNARTPGVTVIHSEKAKLVRPFAVSSRRSEEVGGFSIPTHSKDTIPEALIENGKLPLECNLLDAISTEGIDEDMTKIQTLSQLEEENNLLDSLATEDINNESHEPDTFSQPKEEQKCTQSKSPGSTKLEGAEDLLTKMVDSRKCEEDVSPSPKVIMDDKINVVESRKTSSVHESMNFESGSEIFSMVETTILSRNEGTKKKHPKGAKEGDVVVLPCGKRVRLVKKGTKKRRTKISVDNTAA
eukprot:scaffold732_cov48-Attheya_sp.AAC.8